MLRRWIVKAYTAALTQTFIPSGERRLSILIFHRVRPTSDPLFPNEPDCDVFDQFMRLIAESFTCLPLDQAIEILSRKQKLPKNAVAITFDDGYADNFTQALPILQKHNLSATFFISSGYLDGGCMWNDEAIELVRNFRGDKLDLSQYGIGILASKTVIDKSNLLEKLIPILKYKQPEDRRAALDALRLATNGNIPTNLMMTTEELRKLYNAGMCIGGHTLTHPILARIDQKQAEKEICEDRERITAILGCPPKLFAYPNGKPGQDYLPEHAELVRKAGYSAAVCTTWGVATPTTNLYEIPRFTPWDRSPLRFALRLSNNFIRKAPSPQSSTVKRVSS